jgi:hypothetical protein
MRILIQMKTNTAYIIGNGASRKDLNLEALRDVGTIFGCNALYRDFDPDYLVAIDDKIIEEIKQSYTHLNRCIFPPEEERYEPLGVYGITSGQTPRSNAGMVAMQQAIQMGYTELICFGFDFLVVDDNVAVSNLYDGTNGYEMETRAVLRDTRGRMRFLAWLIETNPDVNFIFAYPNSTKVYAPISDNVKVNLN